MSTRTSAFARAHRRALADELAHLGDLRTPPWRAAVESVPREVFLSDRIYRRIDGQGPTLWQPVTRQEAGPQGWLDLAYENVTWVTQFDGTDAPHRPGLLQGTPTSSSTLPGLVVRMLEDLRVRDGDRVMEIGTGTGYSTALLCQRLGDRLVTSIEVDPGVADRAKAALHTAGHTPRLVIGDGLAGHPDGAPYDRIIATCSVRTLPLPWLAQAAPGARIIAPLSGWLYGSGLAALTVGDDGTATGSFLPGMVSFMPARAHAAPPFSPDLPAKEGDTRAALLGPEILQDWTGRFLAQLAAPTTTGLQLTGHEQPEHLLIDHATGSHAWLIPHGDGWTAIQHGPVRLWDLIEETITTWHNAGQPAQSEFTLHIKPHEQTVRLHTTERQRIWRLPTP